VILVDTSVWVDHVRAADERMNALLAERNVLIHPLVIGELSVGNLSSRGMLLASLSALPKAIVARDSEVLDFIEDNRLFGLGIGYVDVHLVVSARITPEASLWTRDRRLHTAANRLGLAAHLMH
jgi:predicted nucleic acid-binding protein